MSRDPNKGKSLGDYSMLELFQSEIDTQTQTLTDALLALERAPVQPKTLEVLMRAAHSLKGAARLVSVKPVERVAHALEDVFVAAQHSELTVGAEIIDVCLKAVDVIKHAGAGAVTGVEPDAAGVDAVVHALHAVRRGAPLPAVPPAAPEPTPPPVPQSAAPAEVERAVRVSAERLNRILGLSSELVVESQHVQRHAQALLQIKKRNAELMRTLDALRESLADHPGGDLVTAWLKQTRRQAQEVHRGLGEAYNELDNFERRFNSTAARTHREVILTRMRPFADGVTGFQRMVRDLARATGKKVELAVKGLRTEVDRDVLEKLEAPLTHLLRNALDHGIEFPDERRALGKPAQGSIELSAGYSGGMLSITVQDDGRGVDFDTLRRKIVERGFASVGMAERMNRDELIEFLYLPKFSTRDEVTDLSGRGVGLDVVRDAILDMGGAISTSTTHGHGMKFVMRLPITLSLLPGLLVEVAQESYAFPLARIDRLLEIAPPEVQHIEGRQYVVMQGENVGLVPAAGLFGKSAHRDAAQPLLVVVVSDRLSRYGVVVDRILGERVLAVQTLDPRLGKVKDISAAAILEDGTPTLIIDVDDLVRTIDNAGRGGELQQLAQLAEIRRQRVEKHVLVVDDSITVRGVEAKLLEAHGYHVTTAVDGMDGWNRVRGERFDLVITDVDMPRMDGLELVQLIKADPQLRRLPVMIVSYKDRPEDRRRGLDAGADYYLTKGSFHDETLVEAVIDLIGKAGFE
jgi:two-component system sensor histidine kinase and response regulator WspE